MWIGKPPRLWTASASFTAAEDQTLPPFPGPALHGALGWAVKEVACVAPQRRSCQGCPAYGACDYVDLFESPAVRPSLPAGIREQAPRPLSLAPLDCWSQGRDKRRLLRTGETLRFRLTLIGRAADMHEPLVREGLRRVSQRGLARVRNGSGWRPARLAPRVVLAHETDPEVDPLHLPPTGTRLRLRAETPARLQAGGRIAPTLAPSVLLPALVRRANALAILYGSGDPCIDPKHVDRAAASVHLVEEQGAVVDVFRWSARQRKRIRLPGWVGESVWEGAGTRDLRPLLAFAAAAQVGKATTLGFGRISVRESGAS